MAEPVFPMEYQVPSRWQLWLARLFGKHVRTSGPDGSLHCVQWRGVLYVVSYKEPGR